MGQKNPNDPISNVDERPIRGEETDKFARVVHEEMETTNQSLVKGMKFWLALGFGLVMTGAAAAWGAAGYMRGYATKDEVEEANKEILTMKSVVAVSQSDIQMLKALFEQNDARTRRTESQVYEIAVKLGARLVAEPPTHR